MTGATTNQIIPEIMAPVGVVTHQVVDHVELRPEEEVIEGVSIQTIGMARIQRISEIMSHK